MKNEITKLIKENRIIIVKKWALILFLNLINLSIGLNAQNIGDSKSIILGNLTGKLEINKLQSGEEQIYFSEERNSKIIGKYERTTIYWIGIDKICKVISIIEPVSEYKAWCDKLNSEYTSISSNLWKDSKSAIKISIRSEGDAIIMIVFDGSSSLKKESYNKSNKLGTKKLEDMEKARSLNNIIKENGENRYCYYPYGSYNSKQALCIKYNIQDIAIERDYHFPNIEEAISFYKDDEQNFPNEVFPFTYLNNNNNANGIRLNPYTKEKMQILIDIEKKWYVVTYTLSK
jgi:hypothetical protein